MYLFILQNNAIEIVVWGVINPFTSLAKVLFFPKNIYNPKLFVYLQPYLACFNKLKKNLKMDNLSERILNFAKDVNTHGIGVIYYRYKNKDPEQYEAAATFFHRLLAIYIT